LCKFKKAGQLAFLYLLVLFLSSCGGGGGSTGPEPPPTEISSGIGYTSLGDWIATVTKFSNDCDTENANCTEQQARSILEAVLSAISIETKASHLFISGGTASLIFEPTGSSYSLAVQGNSLMETLKFNPGVTNPSYPGLEITSDFLSYPTFEHSFPGSLSGLLSLEHEEIGITDSSLNEKVFKGIHIRPIDNSGIMWSGTQYSWAEIAELDYGNACNYSGDPRYCQSVSLDNKLDMSLVGKIFGSKTNAVDMPSSNSSSYRSYAVSKGYYEKGELNFLYTGNFSMLNNAGCGSNNPSHRACHWKTSDAVSAEQFITADFSTNSLQGTISMQNHYYESSSGNLTLLTNSNYDLHKQTLENLSISATISGNSFMGTVQNSHFGGSIYGNFYGPNAREIGAIIVLSSFGLSGSYYDSNSSDGSFALIVISGTK